jgi:hypothetical protein
MFGVRPGSGWPNVRISRNHRRLAREAASYSHGGALATPNYDLCEQALGIDPRNVRALIQLARYYSSRVPGSA